MKEKPLRLFLCALCAFVVQLLLTGCETTPTHPPAIHKEKGRDVYRSWAVTGCVANMESTPLKGLQRPEAIDLCRTMADLFKKNQCRMPIPVTGRTQYVHP